MSEKKSFLQSWKEKLRGGSTPVDVTASEKSSTEIESSADNGFFSRMRQGLSKTHDNLVARVDRLVLGKKRIDPEMLEELEEILITADLGMTTTQEVMSVLAEKVKRSELDDGAALRAALRDDLAARLLKTADPLRSGSAKPFVIMVVGVNGVGKTTTIGKLAAKFSLQGKRVVLAAADTFRAAAAEQLQIWGERSGAAVIRHKEGADPAAVVFDACKAAVARGADILIVDTAGRLHTKVNLMEELKKLYRILGREIPGAPHETLLVVDATTGQNAISQTKMFREASSVSGIALTKLDGTAKGGIVIALSSEFGIPIRFVGVGEGVDDLREFNAEEFVQALFV